MKLHYYLFDVFTDTALQGNSLAVIIKSDNLSGDLMQKIAGEFNLSEIVFLMQPVMDLHSARVRIFTPETELPFSGHSTIGAAVLLGLQQRSTAIRLEEKVGLITCVMETLDSRTGKAHFRLPQLPVESGPAPEISAIAQTLGINPDDIGFDNFLPERFSVGLEFTLVPVRDAQVLAKIKLQRRGWEAIYGKQHSQVYVFAPTPKEQRFDFAARMFEPHLVCGEDPGTGAAVAALIGFLAKNGTQIDGQKNYTVRQGWEMDQRCEIEMQIGFAEGVLKHAGIGGKAVMIGQGELDLGSLEVPGPAVR